MLYANKAPKQFTGDINLNVLIRKTTEYSKCQGFGKTFQNKWTYLSYSNEKWQHIITQSKAKLLNVNSALEKETVLSLVDRCKDVRTRITMKTKRKAELV